jgi:hypothetical protein
MILCFDYVLCLIQLWIPLMWVWLWYFTQCIHLCLYLLRRSWVIFFSFFKHINIGVFIHLPMFHLIIVIWKCKLIHKPRLYTSCNIPPLVSHRLWTWDFLRLIKYYRSPYSILISMILNHRLQLKSILHSLTWMSSRLHLFLWRVLFGIMHSLKTPSPYIPLYHFLW